MQAFGQALDLRDEPALIEKYREHHRAVWPDVLEALRTIGISEMRIFLLGTHLFMYYEASDDFVPERDFARYTEVAPRANEWNDLMMTFQEKAAEAGPDDWWTPMELVFDLNR